MTSKNVGRTRAITFLSCILFGMAASIAAPPDFAPPVAAPVSVTLPENMSKQVTFSASDTHLVGSFTYAVKSSPSHGQVSAVNGDQVTYTPARGYVGPDTFTYSASDNDGESDPATVTISITAASVVSLPALNAFALSVLAFLLAGLVLRKRAFV